MTDLKLELIFCHGCHGAAWAQLQHTGWNLSRLENSIFCSTYTRHLFAGGRSSSPLGFYLHYDTSSANFPPHTRRTRSTTSRSIFVHYFSGNACACVLVVIGLTGLGALLGVLWVACCWWPTLPTARSKGGGGGAGGGDGGAPAVGAPVHAIQEGSACGNRRGRGTEIYGALQQV